MQSIAKIGAIAARPSRYANCSTPRRYNYGQAKPPDGTFKELAAGAYTTCGIKTDPRPLRMTRFSGHQTLLLLAMLGGCAGAPKELPPRTPPARQIPDISLPPNPPAPGMARVVLHVTDGPMRIQARSDLEFLPPGDENRPTRFGELCVTPCVVDLPAGRYKLYLTPEGGTDNRGDVDMIDVHEGTNFYIRAPGKVDPPKWIRAWPVAVIAGGLTMLTVGGQMLKSHYSGVQASGVGLMVGGIGVMTGGGIYLYDASRGSTQQGATTSWCEPNSSR